MNGEFMKEVGREEVQKGAMLTFFAIGVYTFIRFLTDSWWVWAGVCGLSVVATVGAFLKLLQTQKEPKRDDVYREVGIDDSQVHGFEVRGEEKEEE